MKGMNKKVIQKEQFVEQQWIKGFKRVGTDIFGEWNVDGEMGNAGFDQDCSNWKDLKKHQREEIGVSWNEGLC